MSRWIAFDPQTADAIRNLFGPASAETASGDPLKAALQLATASVVILPSFTPAKALLAYLRPKACRRELAAAPITYEPSGFLGLSDAPVLPDEAQAAPEKKHWWQRKKTV